MTDFDQNRIIAETFVAEVRYHETVDSTNDAAFRVCEAEDFATPMLVVTGQQTAGRGRGANQWWSADGALTFSLIIRPEDLGLAERAWPQASLTTGLAVCLALSELAPRREVLLKWPNDVHLDQRKICGVLVEVGPRPTGTLVLGIGVNVNNSFRDAPEDLQSTVTSARAEPRPPGFAPENLLSTATSMVDATHKKYSLNDVLIGILQHLERQLARLSCGDPSLADEWQQRCALLGRTLEIDAGSGRTTGVCQGIDRDGALVLLTEGGPSRFFGGVVTQVR